MSSTFKNMLMWRYLDFIARREIINIENKITPNSKPKNLYLI